MPQPNFIIILTDDQGYGDLSCMGNPDFSTPHLDALAAGGARFTQWYCNSPVSSPSRAAVRQGRWKLTLQGQLVENAPPQDEVFLADLQLDPGEQRNLRYAQPAMTEELTQAALAWRQNLEDRWATTELSPTRT